MWQENSFEKKEKSSIKYSLRGAKNYFEKTFQTGIVRCLKRNNFSRSYDAASFKGKFPYLESAESPAAPILPKVWSNFDSNFPNDDIVHTAQSDVPDVSRNFFTKYSSYWDFHSISEIIRIFPEYLWYADPPGTLSKLCHSYPGANSKPNKENLFSESEHYIGLVVVAG